MSKSRLLGAGTVIGLVCIAFSAVAIADQPQEVDLQVGDVAPLFTGTDDQGNPWKLGDHVGKKILVLYFYPADFTTGCTRQAVAWRDNMNKMSNPEVEVIGISGDSIRNHKLFKKTWRLNFALLADEEAEIPKKFGVPVRRGGTARAQDPNRIPLLDENGDRLILERKSTFLRWTFVIDRDGKIAYKNTKVKPLQDSEEVLAFIANMPKQ